MGWETEETLDPEEAYWEYQMPNASTDTLEMSRTRRSEIWEKGWWSCDDESKVVHLPLEDRY
jgi:hypothetical protein